MLNHVVNPQNNPYYFTGWLREITGNATAKYGVQKNTGFFLPGNFPKIRVTLRENTGYYGKIWVITPQYRMKSSICCSELIITSMNRSPSVQNRQGRRLCLLICTTADLPFRLVASLGLPRPTRTHFFCRFLIWSPIYRI